MIKHLNNAIQARSLSRQSSEEDFPDDSMPSSPADREESKHEEETETQTSVTGTMDVCRMVGCKYATATLVLLLILSLRPLYCAILSWFCFRLFALSIYIFFVQLPVSKSLEKRLLCVCWLWSHLLFSSCSSNRSSNKQVPSVCINR